jgi:transcriptional regulator with XRE-family HTH domain
MKKTIYTPEATKLTTWLKKQREAKGLTMREVGNVIGKPHSYVGKVETGERRLDVVEFVWYCKMMGFDANEGLNVIQAYVDEVGLPS